MTPPGRLTVVGTGVTFGAHVTQEARDAIERAEEVLYLVADPVTERWLEWLKPNAMSLRGCYAPEKPRGQTYAEMVDEIVTRVREGRDVCAVFYGHPGVFVYPAHEAMAELREE